MSDSTSQRWTMERLGRLLFWGAIFGIFSYASIHIGQRIRLELQEEL